MDWLRHASHLRTGCRGSTDSSNSRPGLACAFACCAIRTARRSSRHVEWQSVCPHAASRDDGVIACVLGSFGEFDDRSHVTRPASFSKWPRRDDEVRRRHSLARRGRRLERRSSLVRRGRLPHCWTIDCRRGKRFLCRRELQRHAIRTNFRHPKQHASPALRRRSQSDRNIFRNNTNRHRLFCRRQQCLRQ